MRISSYWLQVYIFPCSFSTIFIPSPCSIIFPLPPALPNGGSALVKWPERILSPPHAGGYWVDLSTSGHGYYLWFSTANAGSAATFLKTQSSDLPSLIQPSPVPLLNSTILHPAWAGDMALSHEACNSSTQGLDSSYGSKSRVYLLGRSKTGQREKEENPDCKQARFN